MAAAPAGRARAVGARREPDSTSPPLFSSACYAYGRAFNPTTRALAKQLAALEGTEAAYAVSSGLAAIAAVVLRICDTGDSFVCARAVYGGTFALFHDFLPTKCGIHCIFVDLDDPQALAAALARPRVKLLYCETLANPTLVVADLPRLAAAAEKRGVPLVVDNTFAPCAVTPAKHGAAVVVHSLTKGISGASDIIAGAVCGSKAFINSLFAFDHGPVFLLGPTLDPKVAAELGLRMPHLPLRVREAGRRAELFARELEAAGARARHPALLSHPQAALFASLANPGYGAGAVITVDAGSLPAASRLMERLQVRGGAGGSRARGPAARAPTLPPPPLPELGQLWPHGRLPGLPRDPALRLRRDDFLRTLPRRPSRRRHRGRPIARVGGVHGHG